MAKIETRTESVASWQPLGCIACPKPAEFQETAFDGEQELPVHVRHCGDAHCKEYAVGQALENGQYLEDNNATLH